MLMQSNAIWRTLSHQVIIYNFNHPQSMMHIFIIISCVGNSQCRNSSISCRAGDNCIINCDGRAACKEAEVACPSSADCTINCAKNRNICLDMKVNTTNTKSYQCSAPECPKLPVPFTGSPSRYTITYIFIVIATSQICKLIIQKLTDKLSECCPHKI